MNLSKKIILSVTLGACLVLMLVCLVFACLTFKITILDNQFGTIQVSNTKTLAGSEVHLSAKQNDGYRLVEYVVKTESGKNLEVKNNTFIMPNENVKISAIYELIEFNIAVNNSDYAQITVSSNLAIYQENVMLSCEIIPGYLLDRYVVTTQSGKTFDVDGNTFKMPCEDVTVSVIVSKVHKINRAECENGSFITQPGESLKGTVVIIVCNPDVGYELDYYVVKNSKGEIIEVFNNSFVMPDDEVTIWAVFKHT